MEKAFQQEDRSTAPEAAKPGEVTSLRKLGGNRFDLIWRTCDLKKCSVHCVQAGCLQLAGRGREGLGGRRREAGGGRHRGHLQQHSQGQGSI